MPCSRATAILAGVMMVSPPVERDVGSGGRTNAHVTQPAPNVPGLGTPSVHRIAEDVYAVTHLFHSAGGGFGVSAGVIFTRGSVIFIDSGMSIASGEYLWNVARGRIRGDAKIYLILTHHHSDHVFGMRVFKDRGATVIAHRGVADELRGDRGRYKAFIARTSGWTDRQAHEILGDVLLSVPDRLVERDTTLHIDGRAVRILVTPGHVPDAICVYDAASRTLFAGDTVYEGTRLNTKFGGPSEWRTWVSHLERLKSLDIAALCPGHGNLCKRDEIDRNISYLRSVLRRGPA